MEDGEEGSDATSEISLLEEVELDKSNGVGSDNETETTRAIPDILQDTFDINDLLDDDLTAEMPTPSPKITKAGKSHRPAHKTTKAGNSRSSATVSSHSRSKDKTSSSNRSESHSHRSLSGIADSSECVGTNTVETTHTTAVKSSDTCTTKISTLTTSHRAVSSAGRDNTHEVLNTDPGSSMPQLASEAEIDMSNSKQLTKKKSTSKLTKRTERDKTSKRRKERSPTKTDGKKRKLKPKHLPSDVVEVATLDQAHAGDQASVEVMSSDQAVRKSPDLAGSSNYCNIGSRAVTIHRKIKISKFMNRRSEYFRSNWIF